MQTREKPPVVVHPDVESLMKEHMLELCDVIVDRAREFARRFDFVIDQVVIRKLYYPCDEDDSKVIFELCVSGDESKIDEFWDAVVTNVSEHSSEMSEKARSAFDEVVSVFVNW